MKYFDKLKETMPGLKLGWLNPKNPHNCARSGTCPKDTAATNNTVVDATASPVEATKDTAASQPVTTTSTSRPFKKVLE
jgi:hypothetical protein